MNAALRDELLAMAQADQNARRRWSSFSPEEERQELKRDHARSVRTAELIEQHGWPGRSLVGEDGATAAWILIQHASHDVELQERCLELLKEAVANGEASSENLAFLTDRVLVMRGRPQIYGTQFYGRGDSLAARPIDDPKRLDERRSAVGLGPFAEYEALMHTINRRNS